MGDERYNANKFIDDTPVGKNRRYEDTKRSRPYGDETTQQHVFEPLGEPILEDDVYLGDTVRAGSESLEC